MKYDSGMKQYNKDILASVKLMCGKDSKITDKFRKNDGSPAPLRDYLKDVYGNRGSFSNGVRFDNTKTKGMEIKFNEPLNNEGDTSIVLSWSQVTNFIRNNWDEIFYGINIKAGDWVEVDKLGNRLLFDEIYNNMLGEMIIIEMSTSSLKAYKAVKIHCTGKDEDGNRTVKYSDNTNILGTLNEIHFIYDTQRAWLPKKDTEKSYFDIFKEHFPKVEFDVLKGDYCPNEFFDSAPDSIGCDEDCEMCWRSIADEDAEFSAKGMVIPDRWKDEPQEEPEQTDEEFEKDKAELEQASSDTVETETSLPETITEDKQITAVFDYSSLENDTATALRDCETAIRKETAGYFTFVGAKLKEAQELLADHSNGTFEQWYTALGFKRQTVYNLIQRYEFLSSPTIGGREEAFEALPVTLSYEISKPTAPPELVEKVLDGDITSNAEYKKIKAELEEANRKAEFWIKAHTDTAQENQQLRADRVTAMSRADNAERELEKAQGRIKDLESRPVEVAVQPDTAALEEKDRLIEKLKSQLSAEVASVDELNRKNAELRNELEQQENDDVKIFAVKLTYEQLEKLIEIADHQNYYHIAQALKKSTEYKN